MDEHKQAFCIGHQPSTILVNVTPYFLSIEGKYKKKFEVTESLFYIMKSPFNTTSKESLHSALMEESSSNRRDGKQAYQAACVALH